MSVFLAIVAFLLSFFFSLLTGYWSSDTYLPDLLAHFDLAQFTYRYFPNIHWFHLSGAGTPYVFLYPATLYLFEAGLRALTHWDMQAIAYGVIFGSIFLAGLWTALAVRLVTKSWLLSLQP